MWSNEDGVKIGWGCWHEYKPFFYKNHMKVCRRLIVPGGQPTFFAEDLTRNNLFVAISWDTPLTTAWKDLDGMWTYNLTRDLTDWILRDIDPLLLSNEPCQTIRNIGITTTQDGRTRLLFMNDTYLRLIDNNTNTLIQETRLHGCRWIWNACLATDDTYLYTSYVGFRHINVWDTRYIVERGWCEDWMDLLAHQCLWCVDYENHEMRDCYGVSPQEVK